MKSMNLINPCILNIKVALKVLLLGALLTGFACCKQEYIIDNPYDDVNWEMFGRYKADLHAHTSRSYGWFSPHVVVDRYHDLGYEILAVTDHNMVTYPWHDFSTFKYSDITLRRLEDGQLDGVSKEKGCSPLPGHLLKTKCFAVNYPIS